MKKGKETLNNFVNFGVILIGIIIFIFAALKSKNPIEFFFNLGYYIWPLIVFKIGQNATIQAKKRKELIRGLKKWDK